MAHRVSDAWKPEHASTTHIHNPQARAQIDVCELFLICTLFMNIRAGNLFSFIGIVHNKLLNFISIIHLQ